MTHFYNEHDPFAAEWLGNLCRAGLIPDGTIDVRDIQQVEASEVGGYRQCHFFAGIGGWSAALAMAGWPVDRPVWTGSCPCQPFSVAGKKKAEEDNRHLWPEFFRLIRECRPATIFGEQVSSSDGLQWLDGVFADLEGIDYACGAADLPAPCASSPNTRQRLFWVAHTGYDVQPRGGQGRRLEASRRSQPSVNAESSGLAIGMEHSHGDGREQGRSESGGRCIAGGRSVDGLGDSRSEGLEGRPSFGSDDEQKQSTTERTGGDAWSEFRVIERRDEKYCRISAKPGDEPLAYGIPRDMGRREPGLRVVAKRARRNRVGRLRGYGNAIIPQVGAKFVRAFMESIT